MKWRSTKKKREERERGKEEGIGGGGGGEAGLEKGGWQRRPSILVPLALVQQTILDKQIDRIPCFLLLHTPLPTTVWQSVYVFYSVLQHVTCYVCGQVYVTWSPHACQPILIRQRGSSGDVIYSTVAGTDLVTPAQPASLRAEAS
ncbi:hypothetical protein PoB_006514800 [Plakobranchus ocellatus]|uniref:Uncharacterized protein n=1 Tax=Plakobranchus ocellatus TaxID=259542 RepID=A0AAV4D3E5_9GAST|nr:hypothetical protein PoB_006514800 [Plakobranchus ocellatus]